MKKTMILTPLLAILMMTACTQKKTVMATAKTVDDSAAMLADGYRAATVVKTGEEPPCDYQFELESTDRLEILDWKDEFKKDGLTVWIKYTPQRRQSRCGKAMPAEITEIKKRES